MENKEIALPCLRGSIGDWNYYNIVLPFSELNRINNNHIIKEAKSLDTWLQRKLSDRVEKIRDYLLNDDERFFNSIIVGVYGDVPDWYSLNLSPISEKYHIDLGKKVEDSLGILYLSGNEKLFTIDGQHRVEGIKLALQENVESLGNDELSVILIAHKDDAKGKIRTRKLFATINREAVKPSSNDLAVIDEIYSFNVIARDLYANFKPFQNKIALTETTDLDRNNHTDFTNLLSLVSVNKKILRIDDKYKQTKYTGPTVEERKRLYAIATDFWNFTINEIEIYNDYFSNKITLEEVRNSAKNKPLNLLFVPIGQKFLGEIYYTYYRNHNLDVLKSKINLVDFNLQTGHFANIFYDVNRNKMLMNNQTFAKDLFLYLLGNCFNTDELKKNYAKALGINELSDTYKELKLPKQL